MLTCQKCNGTGRIITEHVHSVFSNAECYLVELCGCGQGLTLEQQLNVLEGKMQAYEVQQQTPQIY